MRRHVFGDTANMAASAAKRNVPWVDGHTSTRHDAKKGGWGTALSAFAHPPKHETLAKAGRSAKRPPRPISVWLLPGGIDLDTEHFPDTVVLDKAQMIFHL